MKIRHKITFLVVLPLVAVFAFAALAVVTTGGDALRADQLRKMVVVNDEIGDLVSALQVERSAAVQALTAADDAKDLQKFEDTVGRTDAAVADFDSARSAAGDLPDGLATILGEASTNLGRLDATRGKVSGNAQTSAAVAFAYRIPIADLLSYRESVPQAGGAPSEVGDMIRASTQLLQSSEYQSLEDVSVLRAIDNGPLSELHYAQIVEAASASNESRLAFNGIADQDWRGKLEAARSGGKMIDAQALEQEAVGTPPGQEPDIDRGEWIARGEFLLAEQRELQKDIDRDVVAAVSEVRVNQLWWTGGQIAAVIVTAILMVLVALRLGGPVVRGLRRLSTAARYVATEGLPKAVAQLDDHEELGDRTPEEFAKQAGTPIDVQGRDELADVGRAFNEVHEEAVRVAATQALLRLHIAAMFVRLARRGHSLSGRLTSVLDDAERNEDDPQRLERLFALDHLVSLFARANDSLLVLGGAASSKVRRSSEPVRNVLTAAQGQIEQYTRVNITNVDTDVDVEAGAVDDVVKVLAELLDNATQYSQRQVRMSAWLLTDRLVIQIIDDGIGIDAETVERLNARLASKSVLDLESVQTMGLTVVGHLAARYNLAVVLRSTDTGGTLAEVTVPPELLTPPSPRDAQSGAAAAPPKKPALFDKTRKAENRRRHADTWARRFGVEPAAPTITAPGYEPSPAPTSPPGFASGPPAPPLAAPAPARPTPEPATASGESLGALLLPVIHFDMQNNRVPDLEQHAPVDPDRPWPRPTEPPLFQPDGRDEQRAYEPSGWATARAAAESAAAATAGDNGLPRRDPMAQLVPGSVEPSSEDTTPGRRDPELVSATYVAFARGRPSGRTDNVGPNDSRGGT